MPEQTEQTEKKTRVKRTYAERQAALREAGEKNLEKLRERSSKAYAAWKDACRAEDELRRELHGEPDPDMVAVVEKVVGNEPISQDVGNEQDEAEQDEAEQDEAEQECDHH